jgi:N-acyl-D-amino-acid deacylase
VTTRLLLRGGLVADGIGHTLERSDVLIEDTVIARIGGADLPSSGVEVIELPFGSVVCPGFIDAHVHAEWPIVTHGHVMGALAQGVTTLIIGQDGSSWIGATAATVEYLNDYYGAANGRLEPVRDFGLVEFRQAVSGRLKQNVAVLGSHGTIRHDIAGPENRPLDEEERAIAVRRVEAALADGAVGLSSGLDYVPSRFGDIGELSDIARPLAAAGRPYVSHLRADGPQVRAGLLELLGVGRAAGVRVHASHLCGPPADIEACFAAADVSGVELSYDMYPYRKASTILAALLLPAEFQSVGPAQTLSRLRDRRERFRLLAGDTFAEDALADIVLGHLPEDFSEFAGLSVTEAAARCSQPAGEWVLDLIIASGLHVGAHLDRPSFTDEHLAWLLLDDRHCAGSDGIYFGQHPHPRGYGTFARLAQYYVRDSPGAGYQQLVRHLSTNAADVHNLTKRGRLAPGMAADICVIAPSGIVDRATYDAPCRHATGVRLVIVNGTPVWWDDKPLTARTPGKVVDC